MSSWRVGSAAPTLRLKKWSPEVGAQIADLGYFFPPKEVKMARVIFLPHFILTSPQQEAEKLWVTQSGEGEIWTWVSLIIISYSNHLADF